MQVPRPGPGDAPPVGVVLAGGASSRLGRDKALLLAADGRSLVARATALLARVVAEVVVADRGRGYVPGLPSLADGPGRGPAAALLGTAAARPGRRLLALACDLPGVPAALLAELARTGDWDWVVPRSGRGLEPLCACYGPRALAALAVQVARGRLAVRELATVPELSLRVLGQEELAAFGDPEALFANVNTPADREGLGLR